MLGKLLKYEIKATARIFLPLYALLLIFTGVNRLFYSFNIDSWDNKVLNSAGGIWAQTIRAIAITLYIAIIVAICIMTLVVTVQRFYKNLLGEEGYLMNTLPVTVDQHIVSKMLISLFWQVISLIVGMVSIILLMVQKDFFSMIYKMLKDIGELYSKWGQYAVPLTFEGIFLVIISAIGGVLGIYAAIMIGSLSNKHRLLASFGAYLGLGIAGDLISCTIMSLSGNQMINLVNKLDQNPTPADVNMIFQMILIYAMITTVAFTIAYYIITRYMMKKKLNLE